MNGRGQPGPVATVRSAESGRSSQGVGQVALGIRKDRHGEHNSRDVRSRECKFLIRQCRHPQQEARHVVVAAVGNIATVIVVDRDPTAVLMMVVRIRIDTSRTVCCLMGIPRRNRHGHAKCKPH